MAVETSAKPNLVNDYDYDDDDDGPVIFKRSNAASKPNQLNFEVKKSSSQRHDGKQISDVHSLNGVNSNSQKGKVVSSSKASPVKSPTASPKASTSSAKASPVKPPVNTKSNSDSEDSEDDKPLSTRLKGNSNHASDGLGKPTLAISLPPVSKNIVRRQSEDSDDEPLSSRFQVKSNAGTSGRKPYDADEKKPLVSKNQYSGSIMTDKQQKPLASKRPLDKNISSDQSLTKKPKLLGSPTPMKNKQVAVKSELKAEDDDHIPISQRMKSPASNNKLPTTKNKVTKPVSSSFKKTTMKNKKTAKNSKYSKSTKLLPSSGDGQKKWTTLVHNGVIFPPPYNSHGVKMLYNGKPVDLTPEQEEVGLSQSFSFCFHVQFCICHF